MRSLTPTFICLVLAVLVAASAAVAEVPQLINYQGQLTDGAGTPLNTTVQIVFTIYDGGGVSQWSETHPSVTVQGGMFNVLLGSVTGGLVDAVFADTSRYLGIKVGGDPEITPRTRLVTVPYGMRVATVDGASGGEITSRIEAPSVRLGSPLQNGLLELYATGVLSAGIEAVVYTGYGGSLAFFDENGWWIGSLEPDVDGDGGYFAVGGPGGWFSVDGTSGTYGSPTAHFDGMGSSVVINTNETGDASVSLPTDAVSSVEILNEPGIAQGYRDYFNLTGKSQMVDVVTVTINIPSSGYVVVDATGWSMFYGTTGQNYIACQIDTTAGGHADGYYFYVGMYEPPNTYNFHLPVAMRRTYYEPSGGSKTYRFEAMDATGAGQKFLINSVITATYIPTSYGSVTTLASSSEAAEFETAELVTGGSNRPGETDAGEPSYVVDLRELELKAAKTKAAAIQAERDLLKAQMERQRAAAAERR